MAYPPEVERWRSTVAKYFRPEDVSAPNCMPSARVRTLNVFSMSDEFEVVRTYANGVETQVVPVITLWWPANEEEMSSTHSAVELEQPVAVFRDVRRPVPTVLRLRNVFPEVHFRRLRNGTRRNTRRQYHRWIAKFPPAQIVCVTPASGLGWTHAINVGTGGTHG